MSRNLERKLATLARELSFKAIFQLEFNSSDNKEACEELAIKTVTGKIDDESEKAENLTDDEDIGISVELSPKDVSYIERVVKNTMLNLSEIDEIISAHLKTGWSIQRIAAVDRNVLRLAIYELKFDEAHLPKRIIINDAVDLAKKYGTEHSGRFVNGVLGAIVK